MLIGTTGRVVMLLAVQLDAKESVWWFSTSFTSKYINITNLQAEAEFQECILLYSAIKTVKLYEKYFA